MRTSLAWRATIVAAAMTCGVAVVPAHADPSGDLPADRVHELVTELQAALPAGYAEQAAALAEELHLDSRFDPAVQQVIDPADHQCPATTPVRDYLAGETADWTLDQRVVVLVVSILNPVVYDAALFPPAPADRHFGSDGQFTSAMAKHVKDLNRFWDIAGEDIDVVPMHGDMLTDPGRVARVLRTVHRYPDAQAAQLGQTIATLVDQDVFDHGNHPIFTFNAYAATADEFASFGLPVSDKILMGDGVMEGFAHLGYGDVAPPAILAHEYGHHVQYRGNVFDQLTTPEESRRAELMADGLASYHLTHALGTAMQWKRVQRFSAMFANIGDCDFAYLGHHGTPAQRARAGAWGYELVKSAPDQGHVLPSATVTALFDEALPEIVAPDA